MEDVVATLTAIIENLTENVQLLTAVQAENQGLPVDEDIALWQAQIAKFQNALDSQANQPQPQVPQAPVVASV